MKAACLVREFSTFEIAGERARMQLKRTVYGDALGGYGDRVAGESGYDFPNRG